MKKRRGRERERERERERAPDVKEMRAINKGYFGRGIIIKTNIPICKT